MRHTLRTLRTMAGDLVCAWRAVEQTRTLATRLDVELMRGERMLSRYAR